MPNQFAYSLVQDEALWRWRVLDEDGETVAHGAETSEALAKAAVGQMIPPEARLVAE